MDLRELDDGVDELAGGSGWIDGARIYGFAVSALQELRVYGMVALGSILATVMLVGVVCWKGLGVLGES